MRTSGTSGIQPRGTQGLHHAAAQRFGRAGLALFRRRQRGEKDAGIVVMRETTPTALEMSAYVAHAFGRQFVVEVVPELLDCGAAVDFVIAVSHPSFRVG